MKHPHDTGSAVRRGRRDWAVDLAAFVLAAAFSVLTSEAVVDDPRIPEGALIADQIAGALACCALWLRRRWPVTLAAVLVVAGVFSHFVAGPQLAALFTVAVHRPFRTTAVLGAASLATLPLQWLVRPVPDTGRASDLFIGCVLVGGAIGWGLFVRSRRQLVASLQERAERAEAEAELRAERAQRAEREAIAREMHDVLAHRLSLLSVHAGALEFRPDAPTRDVARAAGVIRDSAHRALEELREVIGVLRAGPPDAADESSEEAGRPQPTLADLPRLAGESGGAGAPVTLDQQVGEPERVPQTVGRAAYRIVQEGLTNARKHAPGSAVRVTVEGAPGEGLTVRVRNRLPHGGENGGGHGGEYGGGRGREGAAALPGGIPGAGQGLTGLAERVALAGGDLRYGPTGDAFELTAWLPWSP
ncbi:histidine kinase [Streptomyces sp. ODS28]|uniref:sensor histidine kinase n=1 Tax=Streptomyces sp. ODS28 TaxID=3136688 RepID=UPI0031EBF2E3